VYTQGTPLLLAGFARLSRGVSEITTSSVCGCARTTRPPRGAHTVLSSGSGRRKKEMKRRPHYTLVGRRVKGSSPPASAPRAPHEKSPIREREGARKREYTHRARQNLCQGYCLYCTTTISRSTHHLLRAGHWLDFKFYCDIDASGVEVDHNLPVFTVDVVTAELDCRAAGVQCRVAAG